MAMEIEAKMKVPDLESIRQKLRQAGATRHGAEFETNIFFDTETAKLKSADTGLRIRIAKDIDTGKEKYIVTMKGPLQKGDLKSREETQFEVDDPQATAKLFTSLGYPRQLSFEKRRETWQFADCEVVLDEVPLLGTYVEIEGPSRDAVMSARKALGLDTLPLIQTGYIALLAAYLKDHKIEDKEIKLSK